MKAFQKSAIQFDRYALSNAVSIRTLSDFKSINQEHLFEWHSHGRSLIKNFRGLRRFFEEVYPFLKFRFFHFSTPRNYWDSQVNQTFYLEELANRLRPHPVLTETDWQVLDYVLLKAHTGGSLLHYSTIGDVLRNNWPEFYWRDWNIFRTEVSEERRLSLDRCFIEVFPEVEKQEDLPSINSDLFFKHLPKLVCPYNGSLHLLLSQTYPELFPRHRNSSELDYSSKRLGIDRFIRRNVSWVESKEGLEEMTSRVFGMFEEGNTILTINKGSPQGLLEEVYPELSGGYGRASRGFWKSLDSSQLIQRVMQCYYIRRKEDWYKVSVEQISAIHGRKVLKPNMIQLLVQAHPEEEWKMERFSENLNRRSRQRYLGFVLREVLGEEVVFEDYWFRWEEKTCVFDFYVPGLGLVVEYQGEQHYYGVLTWATHHDQIERDTIKKRICQDNNLRLVCVPYWWDNTPQALKNLLL